MLSEIIVYEKSLFTLDRRKKSLAVNGIINYHRSTTCRYTDWRYSFKKVLLKCEIMIKVDNDIWRALTQKCPSKTGGVKVCR